MDAHRLLQLFPQQSADFDDFNFSSVEIDSRKPCEQALYVAIRGEHHDGHLYVESAWKKGAVAAIVETPLNLGIPQIIVDDSRKALARLANYWRQKINPQVVAITGSNGKTTVKEMLGQILSDQQQTLMTPGNFNNAIGVPLTLFKLSESDRFAVIEMGANHIEEIRELVAIAGPDVVYVNNARAAHIEGFGSLQAVQQAKGEMYQYCDVKAVAVFNEDEAACDYWKSIVATQQQLGFSTLKTADVSGSSEQTRQGLQLSVSAGEQQSSCVLKVYGEHNAQNALAAITLALACGVSLPQACASLNGFSGVNGRQQFICGPNDSVIIDDSYNANPDSLSAAVKVLCSLEGAAWLALGDMAELGDDSLKEHRQAAIDARDSGVQMFFALGEMSCNAAKLFGENGRCFSRHEEMAEFISTRLKKGTNLLVKGSRSAGMEKVVALLTIKNNRPVDRGVNHAV